MRINKHPVVCLLIDDHSDDQKTFLSALGNVAPGSFCYIATDGVEAMRILSYGQRIPDFIFLDIHTSRMNGKEFLENMKEKDELKDIPVVIHATHPAPGELEELYKLGVSGFHVKEFSYDKVRDMLNQYLN